MLRGRYKALLILSKLVMVCCRIAGRALLPGTAVLDIFAAAAALTNPALSTDGLKVISAVFVAPLQIGGAAANAAHCSLDMATGTVQLSTASAANSAQHLAHAGVENASQHVPLQQAPLLAASGRASSALTLNTPLEAVMLVTNAPGPRKQTQPLAGAVAGKSEAGTVLAVAPLDATLQLAAVGDTGYSFPGQLFIPSALQACKAPARDTRVFVNPTGYWACAATDSARSSYRLAHAAADSEVAGSTALTGVQFKPAGSSAKTCSTAFGSSDRCDSSDVLYELCRVVVKPMASARSDAAAASSQCRLRPLAAQPGSATAAAVAALHALGGAGMQNGRAVVLIEPPVGSGQGLEALLRTARLEQPALSVHLTGKSACIVSCNCWSMC